MFDDRLLGLGSRLMVGGDTTEVIHRKMVDGCCCPLFFSLFSRSQFKKVKLQACLYTYTRVLYCN